MHSSVTACCVCFSLGWGSFTGCCEITSTASNRNWLMLRGDSRNLELWVTCSLRPALMILTLMLTVKSPARLSLWICLFYSVEMKGISPICIACSYLSTIPTHLCSLITLELPKKLNHLCWNFPCFISDQRWAWIFWKARGKFHWLLANWKEVPKQRNTFPHLRQLLATGHSGVKHQPSHTKELCTKLLKISLHHSTGNRATPGLTQAMAAWKPSWYSWFSYVIQFLCNFLLIQLVFLCIEIKSYRNLQHPSIHRATTQLNLHISNNMVKCKAPVWVLSVLWLVGHPSPQNHQSLHTPLPCIHLFPNNSPGSNLNWQKLPSDSEQKTWPVIFYLSWPTQNWLGFFQKNQTLG